MFSKCYSCGTRLALWTSGPPCSMGKPKAWLGWVVPGKPMVQMRGLAAGAVLLSATLDAAPSCSPAAVPCVHLPYRAIHLSSVMSDVCLVHWERQFLDSQLRCILTLKNVPLLIVTFFSSAVFVLFS